MGGGIYDGTYPAADPFMRAAMEEEKAVAGMSERCSACAGAGRADGGVHFCLDCGGTGSEWHDERVDVRQLRGKYAGSGVSTERHLADKHTAPWALGRIEELAEELDRLREALEWFLCEIQTNGWADGAEILRRFQSALRVPGGGDG